MKRRRRCCLVSSLTYFPFLLDWEWADGRKADTRNADTTGAPALCSLLRLCAAAQPWRCAPLPLVLSPIPSFLLFAVFGTETVRKDGKTATRQRPRAKNVHTRQDEVLLLSSY